METKNPLALLTLTATQLNLDTWEAERWDWDGTAGLALYPIDFSDRTVKVLQRLANIAGVRWSELRDASMYVFLPDNPSELVTLQFLQAMNGSPLLELEMPQVSQEARTAIMALHEHFAPSVAHLEEALTAGGGSRSPTHHLPCLGSLELSSPTRRGGPWVTNHCGFFSVRDRPQVIPPIGRPVVLWYGIHGVPRVVVSSSGQANPNRTQDPLRCMVCHALSPTIACAMDLGILYIDLNGREKEIKK